MQILLFKRIIKMFFGMQSVEFENDLFQSVNIREFFFSLCPLETF